MSNATVELLKNYEKYKNIIARAEAEMKVIKEKLEEAYVASGEESMKVKIDELGSIQLKRITKSYTGCDIKALELLFPEAYVRTVTTKESSYLDIRRVKR